MRVILAYVVVFFLSLPVLAHETYSGKVVDAGTQEPLEMATILAESFPYGTETNVLGFFSLTADTSFRPLLFLIWGMRLKGSCLILQNDLC